MNQPVQQTTQDIRDAIIAAALPDVTFDGWTWGLIEKASEGAGYSREMAEAVFPSRMNDAVAHFSDLADRWMLDALADRDPAKLRVRDRVAEALMARLEALTPYREAERMALAYWAVPLRMAQAGRIAWRAADRIWIWAGDTATDYNRYTKRGLLVSVMSATLLVWINDDSEDLTRTRAFLDRRIANVLTLGKLIGRTRPVTVCRDKDCNSTV